MFKKLMFYLGGFMSLVSCGSQTNIYDIPTFSPEGKINCIIEIPAGTNKKIEFNNQTKKFEIDLRGGNERVIDFLSYPVNYGFITSTYSDPTKGGDGDALDVIVISEAIETGKVIEIIPIGVLKLIDNNEYDYKIIGVPANNSLRIINAISFSELKNNYPEILNILGLWFLNYDKSDETLIEGWGDEKEAFSEIIKGMK